MTTTAVPVDGTVADGFERVADALAADLGAGTDGAALALYVDGVPVLDVWGGWADVKARRPWVRDTLATIGSATKGLAAICVHVLAGRGAIDVDAPVAAYWPEFAANGKEAITVADVLSHRAGLPLIDATLALDEVLAVQPVVDALAAQAPVWEPGSQHGYHCFTYGWLVGEIVRRAAGRPIGAFLADDVAAPLGAELHIGLPAALEDRVALGDPSADPTADWFAQADTSSFGYRVMTLNGALALPMLYNDRRIWATEMPGAGGVADARSLARLYASCIAEVDSVRTISDDVLKRAVVEEVAGPDAVQGVPTRWSVGFQLPTEINPMLTAASFGHSGYGGGIEHGFADPDLSVGFGYVSKGSSEGGIDAIFAAVRQALDA